MNKEIAVTIQVGDRLRTAAGTNVIVCDVSKSPAAFGVPFPNARYPIMWWPASCLTRLPEVRKDTVLAYGLPLAPITHPMARSRELPMAFTPLPPPPARSRELPDDLETTVVALTVVEPEAPEAENDEHIASTPAIAVAVTAFTNPLMEEDCIEV